MKKQIPNIFTLLNLFFGCTAIVFALQTNALNIYVNDQFNSSFNIPEKLTWSAACIIIAALVDFLDGFVARLLHATSPMGKQLDSLSDVVSFGVAPGVIIYQLLRFSFAREENGLDVSIAWLLPAFILSCAAAYRLAKFNLDESQQYYFKGVPVPAVGILIASFPLIFHFTFIDSVNANIIAKLFPGLNTESYANFLNGLKSIFLGKGFLYIIIFLLSFLMVSNLKMLSLKFSDYSFKSNRPKIILLVIAIIAAIFLQWIAVPVVFIFYIILSLATVKIKSE
jgi:CDP-diacylglycerol--serine O-phosphatidyltransferase